VIDAQQPTRRRLAPAVHAFAAEDRFIVYAGGDDFLVLELDAPAGAELAAVVRGELDLAACRHVDAETASTVIDAMVDDGLFTELEASADRSLGPVHVSGDGPLADQVRALLPDGGAAPLQDADLVIACAGWLPDSAWRELDRRLIERGVCWHRCWGDGDALFIGPLSVPGHSAGHEDVRRRQLAATDSPDLLLDLWRHWDGDETAPFPWPDSGVLAIAAGMMIADAHDLADGRLPQGALEQRELSCSTRSCVSHPVLPIPGSAWDRGLKDGGGDR